MLITQRTLHRIGENRITFGVGAAGLEFRVTDSGGGYIFGSVDGKSFIDTGRGTNGPDPWPCLSPLRKEALVKALAERIGGGGSTLADRDQS